MKLHKLPQTMADAVYVNPAEITAIETVNGDGRVQSHIKVHIPGAYFICYGLKAEALIAWVAEHTEVPA